MARHDPMKMGNTLFRRSAITLRPTKRADPIICDGLRSCATPHGR
jgi:hypothetical protein